VTVERSGTGILFVISAPSGTGKSTVVREVVRRTEGLEFSVSYTTRPPRPGEEERKDYHFVSRERFEEMIRGEAFVEWAEVFGNLYGTGLDVTRAALDQGSDLVLDIDTQGALQVREGPIAAVSIMLLPPDFETLKARLLGRGSEDEQTRGRRLGEARAEADEYVNFDYLVINEELEQAVETVCAIVRAERRRVSRRRDEVRRILATFES
jgi:guanylate kinase